MFLLDLVKQMKLNPGLPMLPSSTVAFKACLAPIVSLVNSSLKPALPIHACHVGVWGADSCAEPAFSCVRCG